MVNETDLYPFLTSEYKSGSLEFCVPTSESKVLESELPFQMVTKPRSLCLGS